MRQPGRYTRRVFLIGIASIGGGLALGYMATPAPASDDGSPITCPFLAMNPPDTTNMWTFARGCVANGMGYAMAVAVTVQVTFRQKGLMAVLRHEAPDIYRLREVPGISHDDRYALFQPELHAMARQVAVGGRLTLQDLVGMKEWVADELGVTPNEASRIETALLFVRAGGESETWTVGIDDVFDLIAGRRPSVDAVVTPSLLSRARAQSQWTK